MQNVENIEDRINWKSGHEFSLDGENFVIDISAGKDRRKSDGDGYTLVKTKNFLQLYFELSSSIPQGGKILELGIFQGGSFVLLDKIFNPNAMAAVEIDKDPIVPLVDYCSREQSRTLKTYFGKSQDDKELLGHIVSEDLNGELDLVVDDASHQYKLTAESFHILFPKLKPGGSYVIEDWAWAHTPAHDSGRHGWIKNPSLTRFIFELVTNLGLKNSIHSIEIYRELAVIKKAEQSGLTMPVRDPAIRGTRLPKNL